MELDLSSERHEELPSHHEEQAQVFNNDLFQLHSDNEIPQNHQNDFQDPSPIHHDSRKNLTDRDEADNLKWLDSEMTQKDTLDLNYHAEVGSHHFGGSSQQPGRLEDILREADYALRRSTDLANKVTQDAKKLPPPSSNYQYNTTTTTSADGTTTKTTSTSSYSSYKYGNMFRQENPEPQENNFAQNTPFDDDYHYQDEQQAEQPLRAGRSDSRPLTNSRVAYNLFPIQEDAEPGHETPRDRERSDSGAFEQVKIETQTYNIDHHYPHQNLAQAVLNNGHHYQGYQVEPTSKTIKDEVLRHSRDSAAFDATPATNNYAYYETTVKTATPIGNIDKRIDDILKKHFGEGSENSNLRLSNPSIRPPALNQKYSTASAANHQSPFSSEFTSPAQANSALQIREYSITSPNTQQSQQLKSSGYVPNIMLTSPGNPLVNLASPTSSVLSKERRAEIEREISQGQFKTLTSPLSPERKAEIEREIFLGQHKALVSPLSQERKAEIERELFQKQQPSYQYTYTSQTEAPVFEAAPKSRISHDLFARPAESITLKKSSNFAEPTTTYAHHAPHSMYASDIISRNYWNETPSTTTEIPKKTDKRFTSSLVQKYCNPFFQQNTTDVSQRAMTSPGRSEDMRRYSPSAAYSKVEVFQELVPEPSNEYDYQHEKPQSPHTYRSHDSHRSKEIIYSNIESAEPKYLPSPKNVSPQISMTPQSYGSPGVKDFDAHYAPHHHGPSPQTLAFKAQTLQDDFTSPKRENSPQQIAFKAQSLQDDFTSPKKMNSPEDMKLEYRSNFESGVKNDFIDFDEPFDEEDYPAESPPYGKAVGGDIHTRDHHHNRTPENLEEELENVNLRFDAQDSHKKVFHSPFSWKQEDHYVDFASTPDRNSEQNITAEKHAEIPADPLVSGHETTPDRRMKKLTLKNRNSEERTHEKKNSEVHEDILEDRHNIRSVPEIKQRHKIFENKVFEQDKQLQEEVFNSQRILQEMEKEQKDSEKHRKIIFGEMPQRKGKDLEILLDPLQNSDISPINGGGRTSKTEGNYSAPINSDRFPQQQPPKPQFDLKINNRSEETITDSLGRINSERFPYQLKNGVLDPTESFFDFEQENFATTENSIRRTINKSSMNSIPSLEAKTQVFQEPTETIAPAPASKRTKKRKDLDGQIWIIQEPSAFQVNLSLSRNQAKLSKPGVGLNHQTFKEHLVKVPLITHCFRKFHDRTKVFPNNDN